MYLKQKDVIAVIALLDLYGPTIYPNDKQSAASRYQRARKVLEEKVGHPRFRQFSAVHETEAWLFSDPGLFAPSIRNALPGKAQHPEKISFDEPPSKLPERVYKSKTGRTYKKVAHGKELSDRPDPNAAYRKCPRLRELLDEMLRLAREIVSE